MAARHPWLRKRAAHDSKRGASAQLPADRTSQLWMVHGKWYDLSAFVARHPGGESWLRDTRGCDVTELVETHHFNMQRVNGILAECYVGDAPTDYNSYFDFSPTGLFCVLKRRVAEQLGRCGRHEHPPCAFATHATPAFMFQCRAVLLSHALLFCCTALSGSFILAALTGVTVAALHGIGHNFLHQADNGWMFACIAGGWKVHLNRVSHAISHHPRPNTEWDLEILGLEPWLYNMVSSPENPAAVALYGPLLCASAHLLDILAMWWRLASRRQPTGFRAECLSNAAQLALLVVSPCPG